MMITADGLRGDDNVDKGELGRFEVRTMATVVKLGP